MVLSLLRLSKRSCRGLHFSPEPFLYLHDLSFHFSSFVLVFNIPHHYPYITVEHTFST